MKKIKNLFGKVVTVLVAIAAVGTLAFAAQLTAMPSAYHTAASTLSSNISRVAPVGNATFDIVTTAMSGTPSITATVQGVDSAGNAWNLCTSTAITAAASGVTTVAVGPAIASAVVGANTYCSAPVPDTIRINMVNASGVGTHGATQTVYYNTAP